MSLLTDHVEIEELGAGQFRQIIHPKKIAIRSSGNLVYANSAWVDSGNPNRPHIVANAPLMISAANDGIMRWHPTRDSDVYLEIGDPKYRIDGALRTFDFTNPTRNGNRIRWDKTAASLIYDHGLSFGKMGLVFHTDAYTGIDNREFAFPLIYSGLTRSGRNVLFDGSPVMRLRPFVAYDWDGDRDAKIAVPHRFETLGGTEYVIVTLPVEMDAMSRPVLDPTLTLQPDATDGIDTRIQGGASQDRNFGITDTIYAGNTAANDKIRSLLQFDISSLPAGATLSSATLSLYCHDELNTTDRNVSVHRALTEWWEGFKDTAAPDVGQDGSTYNLRNANGSVAWAGGAGGGSGSDFVSSATDTVSITGTGISFDWSVLADVSAWHAGTATNYGWWGIGTEIISTYKGFSSSDHTTVAQRPKLTVEYTVPAGNPLLMHMQHYSFRGGSL